MNGSKANDNFNASEYARAIGVLSVQSEAAHARKRARIGKEKARMLRYALNFVLYAVFAVSALHLLGVVSSGTGEIYLAAPLAAVTATVLCLLK